MHDETHDHGETGIGGPMGGPPSVTSTTARSWKSPVIPVPHPYDPVRRQSPRMGGVGTSLSSGKEP